MAKKLPLNTLLKKAAAMYPKKAAAMYPKNMPLLAHVHTLFRLIANEKPF